MSRTTLWKSVISISAENVEWLIIKCLYNVDICNFGVVYYQHIILCTVLSVGFSEQWKMFFQCFYGVQVINSSLRSWGCSPPSDWPYMDWLDFFSSSFTSLFILILLLCISVSCSDSHASSKKSSVVLSEVMFYSSTF